MGIKEMTESLDNRIEIIFDIVDEIEVVELEEKIDEMHKRLHNDWNEAWDIVRSYDAEDGTLRFVISHVSCVILFLDDFMREDWPAGISRLQAPCLPHNRRVAQLEVSNDTARV
jgi:hypothetical protein